MNSRMIRPRRPAGPADVADHYDELDLFYSDLWGEHLHHGWWQAGDDRADSRRATLRLLEKAAGPLGVSAGDRVIDIGCGYGGTSRWLADAYDVHVTGVTLSEKQLARAATYPAAVRGSVELRQMDWLANDFADGSFDRALAVESLAHMEDKDAFFRELYRTLKPGGQGSICCWLAAADPTRFERHQLRKICEEGRLPGLPPVSVYLEMAAAAGFTITIREDWTREVARTWTLIARRMAGRLSSDGRYLRFLTSRMFRQRIFALTIPRMIMMFATGGIRYGWLLLEKPDPRQVSEG